MVEGKTSISISHRMGSCKSCEKILVFDDGKLIQKGTHEELVSKKQGRYYELYQAQKKILYTWGRFKQNKILRRL